MALQPEVRPPSAGVRRAIRGTRMFGVRDLRWLNIVGRLREGHTLQESQSALDVVASRLRANYPESNRSGMTLHISTWSDPMSVVSAVRAAIREIDPQLVFARPRLLSSEFEQSLGAERMMAVLVGLFAAVALLLAVVGSTA